MKKRILSFVLLLACVTVLASVVAFHGFAADTVAMADVTAGTATVEAGDTVTISTADDVLALAAYVEAGGLTEGVTFLQTANIAMPNVTNALFSTMNPIGTATNPFRGVYDGAGYTISNVQLTKNTMTAMANGAAALTNYRAPFAYIEGAEIKNLVISLGSKAAAPGTINYLGGIVASAVDSSITGCSLTALASDCGQGALASGQIQGIFNATTGVGNVGGIAGYANNTVIDGCTVYTNIVGMARVGGIVGLAENGTVISDCRMAGNVDVRGANATKCLGFGGIAGELIDSKIENCFSGGTVKGFSNVGGVVGMIDADSAVENCFVNAKITPANLTQSKCLGTIAGLNNGTVKYAYASVAVRASIKDNIVLFGNDQGTVEHVYFYDTVKNADETYDFVIGSLVQVLNGEVPCSSVNTECPAENCVTCGNTRRLDCEACAAPGETCVVCNGEGFVKCDVCTHQICDSTGIVTIDYYKFEAFDASTSITIGSVENITELDVALNAWITELHPDNADDYVSWVVVGNNIINCAHTDFSYKAYEGEEPTCTETGVGNKHCALCDKLIEENVIVPANGHKWDPKGATCIAAQKCLTCGVDNPDVPAHGLHKAPSGTPACREGVICATEGCTAVVEPSAKHTRPADALACADAICTVCEGLAVSDIPHTPDAEYKCKDTTCTVCAAVIKPTEPHVLPEGAHLCHDNECTACGDTVPASIAHTRPEGVPACKEDVICTVCGDTIATGSAHSAGMAAGCERDQICTSCGKILQPRLGHSYAPDAKQTCYQGINCRTCGEVKKEIVDGVEVTYGPLGNDYCIPNRDGATCTVGVFCSVCGRRMVKPLGHSLGDEATCGKGQSCTVCHTIVENATGEHTLDWANAKEIKPATDVATAIVEVTCTTCARVFERYLPGTATDSDGLVSIEGVAADKTITATTLKVSDFATNSVAANNKLIQAINIAVTSAGEAVTPDGKMKVSFALNNTVLKLKKEDIKLFNLDTGAEISGFTVDGGFLSFETELYGNFAVTTSAEVYSANFPAENNGTDENGAPIGLIIGIAAGAVVLIAVIVVVIVLLTKKKKGGASVDDGAADDGDEGNAE